MKTFTVYAPLYQLNFKASDLPRTTSMRPGPTSSDNAASPSSTGSSVPTETGNPTTTSDPVASLIPSSLRSSATSSATVGATASGTGGSGMPTGTNVGIGVGVGVGVILLLIAAFFVGRSRRKDKKSVTEDAEGASSPLGATSTGLGRKKSMRAELGGAEVVELEGNGTQELPATALSVGRLRQPAAIFELEADYPSTLAPPTPRYGRGDTPVSPVTPARQGAHSPVSPMTPSRPSHESAGRTHQSHLRNGGV